MHYLVRFVLRLYPPWWRRRYGEESQELTEQLLADPDTKMVRTLGSLLFGATTAWSRTKRRADYPQPVSAGGPPVLPPSLHDLSTASSKRRRFAVAAILLAFSPSAVLLIPYLGEFVGLAIPSAIGELISLASAPLAITFGAFALVGRGGPPPRMTDGLTVGSRGGGRRKLTTGLAIGGLVLGGWFVVAVVILFVVRPGGCGIVGISQPLRSDRTSSRHHSKCSTMVPMCGHIKPTSLPTPLPANRRRRRVAT